MWWPDEPMHVSMVHYFRDAVCIQEDKAVGCSKDQWHVPGPGTYQTICPRARMEVIEIADHFCLGSISEAEKGLP